MPELSVAARMLFITSLHEEGLELLGRLLDAALGSREAAARSCSRWRGCRRRGIERWPSDHFQLCVEGTGALQGRRMANKSWGVAPRLFRAFDDIRQARAGGI